ncbi:MAG: adenylate/guanylate cyclase domain-containing protein [Acidimicrobiales bacterium]
MAVDIEYARRDDISIAFTVIGDGPVDLIFGVGLMSHIDLLWGDPHAASWLRKLGAACRVILFDKPGTGLSDPVTGATTVAERAEDFRAVLDAAGSRRAIVFGLSEAGPPAAVFAATYPDRTEALVVASSCARFTTTDDYLPQLEDYVEGHVWGAMWHGADHWGDGHTIRTISPLFRNSLLYSRLAPSVERSSSSPSMAKAIIQSTRHYDVRDVLPAVRVPTLVTGRTEEIFPKEMMEDFAERIPGARLELFPGDEHLSWVGGDDIADAVLRFIDAPASSHRVADRMLATLLYTDLVASTASVVESGDERWRSVLARHDDLIEEETARHGGRVVKTLGDGALALFDRPVQAVRCADVIRARLTDVGLEMRAAIHTGEVELRGDDVTGVAAHLASRLLSHAAANEIVVTGTVRDLTLGTGLAFETKDIVELRDVPGRWEILSVTSLQLSHLRSAATTERERTQSSAHESMNVVDRSLVVAARRVPRVTRLFVRVGSWRHQRAGA